jgi:3-hydroxyisobutyrate dehydrogenase
MKIGFIGLGNMGAPMARNLVAAGHDVTGFDTAARPEGLKLAHSAVEAAMGAEVVILMLPDGAIVRQVAGAVIDGMGRGAVLLDCSTIDVASARAVADLARSHGLGAVDAPVSGGIGGAQAGTLTFMAGGAAADFATVEPLFDVMGARAVHCGAAGTGQAAKICNNMILGATMIATCESIALADKLGLGRQELFDVVSTSSGQSWSLTTYCPAPGIGPRSPADTGYRPGFAAELMLKDLRLAMAAADQVAADTPMGARAAEIYAQFVEAEGGTGRDFSAILQQFEKRSRA